MYKCIFVLCNVGTNVITRRSGSYHGLYIYFTTEKSRSCHVRFYFLPLQIILARLNT